MAGTKKERIKVLIVDDHIVVRAGLRFMLQKHSHIEFVGEAGNRAEALAVIKKSQPDIILLDLDLGDENGLEIMPEITASAKNARVIVLTGWRDIEVHRQAVRLGAMGLLLKDKASDNIILAIEKVHSGEAWLDPMLVASLIAEISDAKKSTKANPEEQKINQLTKREKEVISLVGQGLKAGDIADRLFISEVTVRHHFTSIFAKLEVSDRVELMLYAYRNGLATPPI